MANKRLGFIGCARGGMADTPDLGKVFSRFLLETHGLEQNTIHTVSIE